MSYQRAGSWSITTDLCSSIAQDSYFSLTTHFINSNHERQQACLHAVPFDGSHTGEWIASMITNCLQAWGIAEKLHVVVHDSGSNFVAGLHDGNIPNIPCMSGTYTAVSREGWLSGSSMCECSYCNGPKISRSLHSNIACKTLQKIQKQLGCPKHRLIQDEPTHWNTTFYMLERLIEQRKTITAVSVELDVPVELHASHWVY